MTLFELIGKIFIDNSKAISALGETSKKTEQTSDEIESILQDSESSQRSKVAKIAAIYRKQGQDQSEALKNAWNLIERDTNKSCKSVTKTVENHANDMSSSLSQICSSAGETRDKLTSALTKIATVVTTAFAVDKIIDFGKTCVETAANIKAANSQYEQTFGDMQNEATAAMKNVADASGIVQTRLQSVGTSIYSFAKTTGMESAEAMGMMERALIVTADSAAYYDRSLEDTAESLKSFLKGNFENDAALGLSCTETTRNAAANQLYGKSFIELSEAQKQLTLLQMVEDANKLSGAMGQASRESDGYENIMGNLNETWKQFQATVGAPILQSVVPIIKKVIEVMSSLGKEAGDVASSFGKVLTAQLPKILELIDKLKPSLEKLLPTIGDFAGDLLPVLVEIISQMLPVLMDIINNILPLIAPLITAIAIPLLKVVKQILPLLNTLLDPLIGMIKPLALLLAPIIEIISAIATPLVELLNMVLPPLINLLTEVLNIILPRVSSSMEDVAKVIENKLASAIELLKPVIEGMKIAFNSFSNFIAENFQADWEIGNVAINAWNTVKPIFDGIKKVVKPIARIFADSFSTASGALQQWATNNDNTIGRFFANLQTMLTNVSTLLGGIMSDIGTSLTEWWTKEGGGSEIFTNVCTMLTNIATTVIKVFNQWIKPTWDMLVVILQSAWDNCLKPIFNQALDFFGNLANGVSTIWNEFLSPLVNWVVEVLAPVLQEKLNNLKNVADTIFEAIRGYIDGFITTLNGLIDFFVGVFTGNWKRAWNGILTYIKGVWTSIWSVIKGIINLIIDGVNSLWSSIYSAVKGIVDSIGDVAGALGDLVGKDWSFSMPEDPPLIPKLARGGIVDEATHFIAGEDGKEAVIPLEKNTGWIDKVAQQINKSNPNNDNLNPAPKVTVIIHNFVNNTEQDIEELVEIIDRKLAEKTQRRKAVYGYVTE